MTLAANLLNAVGGRPQLDNPKMLQGYPRPLPHGDRSLEISLFRFGHEAIETFLKIEQPSPTGAPPEGDNYETIGQFYDAIKRGFRELSAALGEVNVFSGDPARQVTDPPIEDGLTTAGPTFEYVASDRRAVRPGSAGERRAG